MEHTEEKTALLMNVANCIKELQKQSTATDDAQSRDNTIRSGRNILSFCGAIELVLRHGLASSWRNAFTNSPSFWAVAKAISRKDAINDLKGLSHCVNDHARARAWIRLAINEQSLESYASVLINDGDTLGIYYEPHAFLRDSEQTSALLGLLAGMSFTMSMDITVNDPSLEFEPTPAAAMNRDKQRMAASQQRTASFSEAYPNSASEVSGRSKGPGSSAGAGAQGEGGDEMTIDFQSATLSSALQDTPKSVHTKTKKKKKKRKSTHSKASGGPETADRTAENAPSTTDAPHGSVHDAPVVGAGEGAAARPTPPIPVDLESSPEAGSARDDVQVEHVAPVTEISSLDQMLDSAIATAVTTGALEERSGGAEMLEASISHSTEADRGTILQPCAENDAVAGTETGIETGTENGAVAGTKTGTETGIEMGAVAGTKTGTETGTEASAVAGTKTGTEDTSLEAPAARERCHASSIVGVAEDVGAAHPQDTGDTRAADTTETHSTNTPSEIHPEVGKGPGTSTERLGAAVGTDIHQESVVAVDSEIAECDHAQATGSGAFHVEALRDDGAGAGNAIDAHATPTLAPAPIPVAVSEDHPEDHLEDISEDGTDTSRAGRDGTDSIEVDQLPDTLAKDGATAEVAEGRLAEDTWAAPGTDTQPLALFSDADDAFADALGYGSPPSHGHRSVQLPGADHAMHGRGIAGAGGGSAGTGGGGGSGDGSRGGDEGMVGGATVVPSDDELLELLLHRRQALGLHSVPSEATSPTLARSPSDGTRVAYSVHGTSKPSLPTRSASLAASTTRTTVGWREADDQGSRSSALSKEQQELLKRLNSVYASVEMMAEDTLEEADQAAAAAVSPKSAHLSEAAWDVGSMSDVECRQLVEECGVHGCFSLRIDDVTTADDAYTDPGLDPRHADWALYVNDRNTVHKFQIENIGPGCFQWDDKSYDDMEALVADLVHGNVRLLSPQTGRPLRITSPAHHPNGWFETTAFSVDSNAAGPKPTPLEDATTSQPNSHTEASINNHSHTDAFINNHIHTDASINNHIHTDTSINNHSHTDASINNHSHVRRPTATARPLKFTASDAGDRNTPDRALADGDDDASTVGGIADVLATPLQPDSDEQESVAAIPTECAAVAVSATKNDDLAAAEVSFDAETMQEQDRGDERIASGVASPGDNRSVSRRVSTSNEDFVLVEDYFQTALNAQMDAQDDDNVDDLQKEIDAAVKIIHAGPPEALSVQRALADVVVLRLRREQARDRLALSVVDDVVADEAIVPHMLHKLAARDPVNPPEVCDCCQKPIKQHLMGILDKDPLPRALRCVDCKITVHYKCMDLIRRQCVGAEALRGIVTKICPEDGLSAQQYKCAECKVQIGFQGMFAEARICDYFGRYMCPDCHHLDTAVIPARVVHNWDFTPRAVSLRAKETLAVLHTRPVMDLNDVNPSLQNHVEEVLELQRARTSLAHIHKFLLTCRNASAQPELLGVLGNRPYLMTTAGMVSIKDLLDVRSGELIRELNTARERCIQHITVDCQRCQGTGSYCELCQSDAVIFPFMAQVTECEHCKSVFHSSCWAEARECPKCVRIKLYALRSKRRQLPEYKEGGVTGEELGNTADTTDSDVDNAAPGEHGIHARGEEEQHSNIWQ